MKHYKIIKYAIPGHDPFNSNAVKNISLQICFASHYINSHHKHHPAKRLTFSSWQIGCVLLFHLCLCGTRLWVREKTLYTVRHMSHLLWWFRQLQR